MQRQWAEEDRQRRKQNEITDLDEIRRRINELRLAAATGDGEAISRIEDLRRQYAEQSGRAADAAERDRREDVRNQLTDRRDDLRDRLAREMDLIDLRRDALEAERDAAREIHDERLRNANLFAEARKVLERGVSAQLLKDLWKYEKEFGEGMGILGDYVYTRLVQQLLAAHGALEDLVYSIQVATSQDLFEKVRESGETVMEIFSELQRRHSDFWQFMKDNLEKFAQLSDEGLFGLIYERFGAIPEAAREALAEALRMLGDGQIDMKEAFQAIFALPIEYASQILGSRLSELSQEQINAIKEWSRLSIEYTKATAEADRARIAAEQDRLLVAAGIFSEAHAEPWAASERQMQVALESVERVKTVTNKTI